MTTTSSLPSEGTITIGYSKENRPIDATVIPPQNDPQRTLLIMGAIHGDEPEGPTIIAELLKYFKKKSNRPKKTSLVIIPIVNPDGLERNTRQNANGVDLNRNFPTTDWENTKRLLEVYEEYGIKPSYEKPEEYYYGGPSASSESETQAMVALLEHNTFDAVIEFHSTRTHTTCPEGVVNDGLAEELATIMAEGTNMALSLDGVGYPTPGSLGFYTVDSLQIPTTTLEFRNGMTKKEILAFGWNGTLAGIQYIDENK